MDFERAPFGTFLLGSALYFGMVYAILFFFVGIGAGIYTDAENLWLVTWAGGTLISIFLSAFPLRAYSFRRMQRSLEFLKSSLRKVDYYKIIADSSIAVDLEERELACEGKANGKEVAKTFSLDKLQAVQVVQGEKLLFVSAGNLTVLESRHNLKEEMKAANNTGLMLKFDDLDTPEIFVRLNFDAAKRWALLFEKMANNNLDMPREPKALPANH